MNNCSKDNTLEICQQYARKDNRIQVHDNTDFLDVMVNHNHALSFMAKDSKYVKFVSGDDWIFPECVEKMVELAEENPNVGIVACYSTEGKRLLYQGLDYHQKVVDGREICRNTLLGKQPYVFAAPTSLLYRADFARATKTLFPFAEGAPHADVSAVYQVLQHSDFGFVHQILTFARVHEQSETSSSFKYGRANRAMLADMSRFGPIYLTPEEHAQHLGIALDKVLLVAGSGPLRELVQQRVPGDAEVRTPIDWLRAESREATQGRRHERCRIGGHPTGNDQQDRGDVQAKGQNRGARAPVDLRPTCLGVLG